MMTFLAQTDYSSVLPMLIPIIVVTLSMCIPIVAIITDYFQKKERMRLIATAIEHGANIEHLKFDDPESRPHLPYRAGMVALAVGMALIAADRYVGLDFGSFHFPLAIGGLITAFVGLALLLNDWLNRDRLAREAEEPSPRI